MARSRGARREYQQEEINEPSTSSEKNIKDLIKIQEKSSPVRIRAGAGINFAHVDGKYLGKGIFEVDEILEGTGSKSGWGHLTDGQGWVALDFVEIVK